MEGAGELEKDVPAGGGRGRGAQREAAPEADDKPAVEATPEEPAAEATEQVQ